VPKKNEVRKIKSNGTIFIIIRNISFLSLRFILYLNFETINNSIIKKGTIIPICFAKKIIG
jgi:hypothetical protein